MARFIRFIVRTDHPSRSRCTGDVASLGILGEAGRLPDYQVQYSKEETTVNEWHDLIVSVAGDETTVATDGVEVGRFPSPGNAHPTKRLLRLAVPRNAVVDDGKIWRKK